jgi:hypothetical protein
MRNLMLGLLTATLLASATTALQAEETIVFFRHGEKPSGGLGQITCQGLNRALALPAVLIGKFGTPDNLYAPNPATKISDPAGSYYYVRPLATIEPTAVRAGRSINARYGYNDVSGLRSVLITTSKANATVFVSWEHEYLVKVAQSIMTAYGHGFTVPAWTTGDYDSLYIIHVDYSNGSISARFERDREGLNGLPTTCPG